MKSFLSFLIAIVFLGVLLFVYQQGVFDGPDFSFNVFNAPSGTARTSSTNRALPSARAPSPRSSPRNFLPPPAVIMSATPPPATPLGLSPSYKKVRISSVRPAFFPSYSEVTLSANVQNEQMNITGWSIQTNTGSQFIPQAVGVYDPYGLTPEGDIVLGNGDSLRLYSDYSANGKNFRINKCIGYLENTVSFKPSLPRNCPFPNRNELAAMTGQCQNYILSLSSCASPPPNPPVPYNDYACHAYLDKLNYGGCVQSHRADADFLGHEWWAWTGGDASYLNKQHDRVLLLDKNKFIVDEYTY